MKKRTSILMSILLIFTMLLMVGCSDNSEVISGEEGNNEFQANIVFDGSSTLAPVVSNIGNMFIEEYQTWDKVDAAFPAEEINIFVSSGGSGAGIRSVIEGTSDFGMAAREASQEEKDQIEAYQDFLIGIDALTIAVNPQNPIHQIKESISTEEIRKIFSGEYKYWNEVDERLPEEEIVVVIRDIGGGAHKVFQQNVMGDMDVKADAIQSPSMGALVTRIIENKNTIGYASYGGVNSNEGKLIALKVDGIEATAENIINGSYKISRPLIMVKKGELTPQEEALIDYFFSDAATNIVEELGFVPVK
ncbi:MAG: phosphate ABC transporter substrate-binding protein [Clostridiaceae bacterium]|nr:phosphate ABC transporter substrate-binding protein [Clostridiaceae bacterium]